MVQYCEEVCGINMVKIVYINQIGLGWRKMVLNNIKSMQY